MRNCADVIIIGSGVIGNAAAYYLAQKGCSVIVLEKSDSIGNGGSTRNGGGVRQSGRDKRELPLAMYGVKNIWPTLSEELEIDVEYYQHGNLRLGKTEEHMGILKNLTKSAKDCGLDVRMISAEEGRNICPYLSEEVIGASWCPTDGHANPLLTTLGYYRRARQIGVRFITGEEVMEIKKIKGKARQVVTQNNIYEGENIILAAGYESRKIASTFGIDIPMNKVLLEVLVTEAQPPMFYQMLGTAAADFYGHQSKHGSFVFGGSSGYEAFNKDNGTPTTSSITASAICRGIMKYFPILEDAKIVRTWAGWIDDCADHIPVISFVEEVPGLILACAFSGHGFGISPTVGMLLSEMVVEGKTSIDVSAFRYDRFKAKI
ncbi:NAD(P)/FAD-dependent oxidoreductase [Clostridium kluyveri]|uniref:FAD-dependent oxidoreductase n=1 Tax=Clostridium kluyveri TaxID=1534 RepID=A0A1L5F597_CLOKL|nr:FAD-binding oxidoreductase [Clostridium kluyveri]APM38132.1 FAD-dependent oxidoreductase [Clostridium kluyveri]UZQ51859.1 FAD-binding oxidoreductase [Clostridium kluyveri]